MRNILIALVIGFQLFPITVYGKGKDAFLIYQEAMQKTVASRNWKEELDMDADMTIIQGKAKTKTKVTLDAVTEVSDYDENDRLCQYGCAWTKIYMEYDISRWEGSL